MARTVTSRSSIRWFGLLAAALLLVPAAGAGAVEIAKDGKPVATVVVSNAPPDAWSLYFTTPEALWMANPVNTSFLKKGESWLKYSALRHFDMANVLFCDGHIETLGADALAEKSDLWGVVPW